MIKAIIFDIDGVIIKQANKKEIIKNILIKYDLYDIHGVKEISVMGLNRKLLFDKIFEIIPFDKESALKDFNDEMETIENSPILNSELIDFIKNNKEKYIFSTNTSLPLAGMNRVISALNIGEYFDELLAFENGTKLENINYILKEYNLNPKDVLFVDDNINHIENVKVSGVNTLHFTDYNISIEKEIDKHNNS